LGGESLVLSLSVKTFCFRAGLAIPIRMLLLLQLLLARFSAFPRFSQLPFSVAPCCRRCRSVSPALDRRCSQVQVCVDVDVDVVSFVLRPVWTRVCYQLVGCWAVSAVNAFSRCPAGHLAEVSKSRTRTERTLDPKVAPRHSLKLMQYSYYLVCLVCSILFYLIWF